MPVAKKDLGMIAMSYGTVYVAAVALSNPAQCIKAMLEAEAFDGPSIILAYSHCIAHGIDMTSGVDNQKKAVQSGYWPLYRYNPALAAECKNPLQLDSCPDWLTLQARCGAAHAARRVLLAELGKGQRTGGSFDRTAAKWLAGADHQRGVNRTDLVDGKHPGAMDCLAGGATMTGG